MLLRAAADHGNDWVLHILFVLLIWAKEQYYITQRTIYIYLFIGLIKSQCKILMALKTNTLAKHSVHPCLDKMQF